VFRSGWGYAVVGAIAIVLAAMYMLRLISTVLHRAPGPAVSLAALDLRPAELGVLVPLVACLLFLSAWPAAITDRSFVASQPFASEAQTVPGVGTGGISSHGYQHTGGLTVQLP